MTDLVERREWLIRKSGYFYRPNRCGYTTAKHEAGRYTEAEARKEAEVEPWHMTAMHETEFPDDPTSARIAELEAKAAEVDSQRAIGALVDLADAVRSSIDCRPHTAITDALFNADIAISTAKENGNA